MLIDGAHVAYADNKGHYVMLVAMDRGAMISMPKKLGLVRTISEEVEVASNGEIYSNCARFRHSRLAQGNDTNKGMLCQNNKSCMQLHNNCPFQ